MAGRKKLDPVSDAALQVARMEQKKEEHALLEQAERERRVAESYQLIGRIQGAKMVADFGNVTGFVWLREVQQQKLYRDMPGIGTWEKFCESVGMSRSKIENGIANLEAFGEEFLVTVTGFGVSYRDLRKLRQLTHEGSVTIEGELVTIGGETIPLDAEHREDLQAALERVIDAKDALLAEKNATLRTKDRLIEAKEDVIKRQEKDLARFEDQAHKAGLTPIEDAFLRRLEMAKATFDIQVMLRGAFDPHRCHELRDEEDPPTPRMLAAYLTGLDYLRKQILDAYEYAMDNYGNPTIAPEEGWTQPDFDIDVPGEE